MRISYYAATIPFLGGWTGLSDLYHRPKEPVITPEAKAWVVA